MITKVYQIARKELASYFSSPVAFLFLGAFLLVNLFVFFWVEKFFARNIADVRPLFEWMPLLLLFLVAALTMRMWSEERRMGTMEFLLTLPVNTLHLVLGKFLACLILLAIALLLTLPIPLTVSFLGTLDWGPVIAAYIASLFLAGAYSTIGLYVSAKSDNQIVSLIGTCLICGVFYLIGSEAFTGLFGNQGSEILKLLSTQSRFDSITRGVIDFRDIFYYLSIIGIFISLNVFTLERLKWSTETSKPRHGLWKTVTALCIINFIAGNLWLHQVGSLRGDFTRGNIYSISDATSSYLERLQEPLLMRGYFSGRTHPLLAPLVPQLRDLLKEYSIAGKGKVRVEFIDPRENEALEEEANQKYGIKPVPFQVSDKYQASLINSYFNVLIQYGDKHEVLGFQELIDVKYSADRDIDVQLRNPEYDITRSIKKVLYGFQSTNNLFATRTEPITFRGYFSDSGKLPEALNNFQKELESVLQTIKEESGGKFEISIQDPEAGDGSLGQEIQEKYGFRPMVAGLFNPNPFFFYMGLADGTRFEAVPLPSELNKESAQRALEAGLKRFSSGFLKTAGIYTPPRQMRNPMMQQFNTGDEKEFNMIRQKLQEGYQLKDLNLKTGAVPEDIDILLLLAPEDLSETEIFAVDQFLMKGGTIVLSSSPYSVKRTPNALNAVNRKSGLQNWLTHYGITLENKMVLDTQNEKYPVPMRRNLGGFFVEEMQLIEYPFFVDIRSNGMNSEDGILSGLPQVTMNWSSPITIDTEKNKERTVSELLRSSENSWSTDSMIISPNFQMYPKYGFAIPENKNSYTLAASVEGQFESFYKGKKSPVLLEKEKEAQEKEKSEEGKDKDKAAKEDSAEENNALITSIIEKSTGTARIILFASNDFIADQTLRISASGGSSRYLNSLQLVQNSMDWSLEDRGLLSIRSRGHFSRTLNPMGAKKQAFIEYLNYAFALLGLLLVYLVYRYRRSQIQSRYAGILQLQGV